MSWVASYGPDVVKRHLEKLEAVSDPSLSRKWILFFDDGQPINYIAKLEGVSPSSVKRSLAKAMKELTDQVAKEEADEETNQPMSHAFAWLAEARFYPPHDRMSSGGFVFWSFFAIIRAMNPVRDSGRHKSISQYDQIIFNSHIN